MSRNFELLQRLDRDRLDRPRDPQVAKPVTARAAAVSLNIAPRTYEELNKLVQRLFLSGPMPARQVLFTGATGEVGCTFVATRSAEVLSAQVNGTVCILQAGNLPGDANHPANLSEANDSTNGSSVRQVRDNLWLGKAMENSSAIPSREQIEARLAELRREFDYVLMDASPVSSPIAITAASLMDGVVLVLKAGQTRRSAIRTAIEELEASNAKLLGTVLNQREYPIPDAIYKRLA